MGAIVGKFFGGCNELIGKSVAVYVDQYNAKNNRIASFWQLWFMPILFALISLLWYPFAAKSYMRKFRNRERRY